MSTQNLIRVRILSAHPCVENQHAPTSATENEIVLYQHGGILRWISQLRLFIQLRRFLNILKAVCG